MAALPARLDDAMLARVEAYGAAPLPTLARTDEAHLLLLLRTLDTLPRRASDPVSAELRVETTVRMLGHLSRPCIDWLADEALRRFTFAPTVAELLDLAKGWTRGDDAVRARAMAGRLAREERQARLVDVRRAVRRGDADQDAVDAMPEPVRRILEAEGLLWRCDCGSYTVRPSAIDRPQQVAA